MKELIGNFWDHVDDFAAICCTTNQMTNTNSGLVMGAGIAKDFAMRYKWLPAEWGRRIKCGDHHDGLMITGILNKEKLSVKYLIAFPTKYDWRNKSDLELIEKTSWTLTQVATIMGWKKILLPRPGCSNGGLKWDLVKSRIGFLDDRFWVITNGP